MIIEINIPLMVSFSVLIILSHVSVCNPKVFCYRMLAYRREKLGRLGVLRPKTDLASSISISKLPEDWACFFAFTSILRMSLPYMELLYPTRYSLFGCFNHLTRKPLL